MTQASDRPVILISGQDPLGASEHSQSFRNACAIVAEMGGTPKGIACHEGRDAARDMAGASGLILLGNHYDIDPSLYHQAPHPATRSERDFDGTPQGRAKGRAREAYEGQAITLALDRKIPILGICGGMQRLNVLLGGSLHQSVPDLIHNHSHMPDPSQPGVVPVKEVELLHGSTLAEIGRRSATHHLMVSGSARDADIRKENALHHQAVDRLAEGFRASALYCDAPYNDPLTHAPRRLIAAIEPIPGGPYGDQAILGMQWHPELSRSDLTRDIFTHFIDKARGVQASRENPAAAPSPGVRVQDGERHHTVGARIGINLPA